MTDLGRLVAALTFTDNGKDMATLAGAPASGTSGRPGIEVKVE